MSKDVRGHGSEGRGGGKKQKFFERSLSQHAPPGGFNKSNQKRYMSNLRTSGTHAMPRSSPTQIKSLMKQGKISEKAAAKYLGGSLALKRGALGY
jgi:hypothetical protein